MKIKIKKLSKLAKIPKYMTDNSAGMDLYAAIDNEITIKPFNRISVPTGIAIAIPKGYEAQIRPRSGLAINHGITVINSPGTIDSDYRGEIKILLINLSNEPFTITPQMRIAQMIISKYETCEFIEVDYLDETDRNTGGFGSTGI